MTPLKRLYATLVLGLMGLCLLPGINAAEKAVGVRVGYSTRNECPLAGLSFQYSFSKHFRLAPAADYMFRHHGVDAFIFNINTQYPFALTANDRWRVYPIAGISYCNWNRHVSDAENTGKDVSLHTTRFGANLGVGLEYFCTPTLKLSVEGKYNMVKSYSAGMFNLGIAYVF